MGHIKINKERCKGCLLCVSFCPNKLITRSAKLNKNGVHYAEFTKGNKGCTGCAICAIVCPDLCIEVYR